MSLCLPILLFFLVTSLPSGNGLFGNEGVEIRVCTALHGRCFFVCKHGWRWVAFCHNVMSCCTKMDRFVPPQAIDYTE
ncbi:Beta-defensin 136 [Sciurus carolinensis]|uniref:Beta-defensin 136 n=1 Tax=Sciurus carolinensis TaxID=30640 RepID=A0AA41MCH6_SCICA|nr:defensin beta 136 [Sciurus carolinensis]MBZ3869364.1 Beta-defensin 136 [Sciurus carolinensis]